MAIPRPVLAVAGTTVLALALVGCTVAAPQPVAPDPRLADPPLSAPGQWFDSQRAIGADSDPLAYATALDQAADARARTAAAAPEVAALDWELLGPTNIGGRVVDVAVDPEDPTRSLHRPARGGVWRSDDRGTTFARAWPADADPGDRRAGRSAATARSTPAPARPTPAAARSSTAAPASTARRDARRDLAARRAARPPARSAASRSTRRTRSGSSPRPPATSSSRAASAACTARIDGGDTWQRVLAGENDTTGAVDIAIDPANPDHLLAAMWDHYRDPERRVYGGAGSGVYALRPTAASTWRHVPEITLPDPADIGRIGVAFAPSDPNRAYAIIANKLDGRHGAFFGSDDGGATWTALPDHADARRRSNSSYGWWFARIFGRPRRRRPALRRRVSS